MNSYSWTFEIDHTKKLHLNDVCWNKQPLDNQTMQLWHQISKQIYNLRQTPFFWDQLWECFKFCILVGNFFQQERLCSLWLARSSNKKKYVYLWLLPSTKSIYLLSKKPKNVISPWKYFLSTFPINAYPFCVPTNVFLGGLVIARQGNFCVIKITLKKT